MRIWLSASASSLATLSMAPLLAWTSGPPNSSLVLSSSSARLTTWGPAMSSWALRVITVKCEATKRAAGMPATGPRAAEATGTTPRVLARETKRLGAKTGSPRGRAPFLPPAPATEPPPPSWRRTSGILYCRARSSV